MTKAQKDKVQILAVSVDSREASKKFGEMLRKRFDGEFDFPLLEDKDHKVIDRYGIFNPDGRGWPYPSTFRRRYAPEMPLAGRLSPALDTVR